METHNEHGVKIEKIRKRFVADDMKEAPTLNSMRAVETIYEGSEGQAVNSLSVALPLFFLSASRSARRNRRIQIYLILNFVLFVSFVATL